MTELLPRLQVALADRYRLDRQLGRGGMATVFLARDLKHDRPVALKVLHPELSAVLGPERFLREIRIAAHLQHPHILTLIDSGEIPADGGKGTALLYYVMPYVEGESLRERLSREGRLAPPEAIRILQDVLDALAYAHRQGIIHRDIKPENIMLSGRHALVVDFGVARAVASGQAAEDDEARDTLTTLTTLGVAIGTPAYMAPEQAAGQAGLDGRTDLYAVGVLGYEMLAGQPPFTGGNAQALVAAHIGRAPEALATRRPDLPAPLTAAIMRCLEKDPGGRWPSADGLLEELNSFTTPAGGITRAGPQARLATARGRWAVLGAGLAVGLLGIWLWTGPLARVRHRAWAHDKAIPRLLTLAEAGHWQRAWTLAREVHRLVPGDSLFDLQRPKFARVYTIHTRPPGAEVWLKAYGAPESTWVLLGRTPLDTVLVPMSGPGGTFLDANRVRIRAPGYRTLELVGLPYQDSSITLEPDSVLPPEMVPVAGGLLGVQAPGFGDVPKIRLQDFLMDRFEVTNRDYKRFVDAGGYRRRDLWPEPIVRDGRRLAWEQAMALMTDRTGRNGPATWEGGEFPAGRDQDPVGGVSWYEAMAYAKFAGKSLPTAFHWDRAASPWNSAWIIPASNFSGERARPVGSAPDMSAFGTYDMAGNVREWCLNSSGGDRFILGGSWGDPPYRFNDIYAQAPFNRSPLNGIRLVRYPAGDTNVVRAAAPLTRTLRNFNQAHPVGDAVFAAYRQMYAYDRTPLAPKVLQTLDEGDWTRRLVRVNAAYGGDTLLLYLYLPKRGARPFPTVVYFPPGSAVFNPTVTLAETHNFDFLLHSGRAVLLPVYKGTFQRRDGLTSDTPDSSIAWRDHVIMWAKDLGRGIDYLETLPEVTTAHLAYYGVSFGAAQAPMMLAVERRITVSVLQVAGLEFTRMRPEVDPVNYLPRVRIPTLMLNGRYDFYFPVETSQNPMFRLLGTPPGEKRHVIEDGSHFVPRDRLIRETLDWLDKYQPVVK